MKNKFFFLFLVLALTVFGACSLFHHSKKVVVMPGTWQEQPIVIDGDNKDWPSPYPNYDSKAKIGYATSNDKEFLYITMETGDEITQMKMLKLGMVVSIDTGGKKNAKFTISYPLQNDNEIFEIPKAEDKRSGKGNVNSLFSNTRKFQQDVKKGLEEANQYVIEGFMTCNGAYLKSQTTPCGIKISLKQDEYKELVWEAAIPFTVLYGRNNIPDNFAGKPISVCFTLKGQKKPENKSTDNTNSPAMSNNMGGSNMRNGGAGSMKGGGGRTSMPDNPYQALYETTKTWKHFGIAIKP